MKHYLYDFDGTIYDGDSSIDFIKFSFTKNKKLIKLIPMYINSIIKYKLKKITTKEFKEKIFSYLNIIENKEELIKEFWIKNEHKIKKFYINKNHTKDIIITASPTFLIEPIAKKLQTKDLFGTKMDINTGKIIGENCKGENKVKIYKEKYPNTIIEEMYTDSLNDKPLLDLANKGYIVKKDKINKYEKETKI